MSCVIYWCMRLNKVPSHFKAPLFKGWSGWKSQAPGLSPNFNFKLQADNIMLSLRKSGHLEDGMAGVGCPAMNRFIKHTHAFLETFQHRLSHCPYCNTDQMRKIIKIFIFLKLAWLWFVSGHKVGSRRLRKLNSWNAWWKWIKCNKKWPFSCALICSYGVPEYNKISRCDLDNFKHKGWCKSVSSILFMVHRDCQLKKKILIVKLQSRDNLKMYFCL